MKRLRLAALAALLTLGTAAAAQAAPSQACRDAYGKHWAPMTEGLRPGGLAKAEPHFAAMREACDDQIGRLVGTMHAEAQLNNGSPDKAVSELEALAIPDGDGIKSVALWVELAARSQLEDKAGFTAARDRMLDLQAARLTDPSGPFKAVLRERFETEAAVIDVFDLNLDQEGFRRRMLFVARPKDGGMFVTGALTLDLTVEAMNLAKGEDSWFLDLYPCHGHSTLTILRTKEGSLPDYAAVKDAFAKSFGADAFKDRIGFPKATPMCSFESFMAPGLYPPGG